MVDNIYCSPLIYQASHFIAEISQVGQACALGESVLTTPDDFHVLGNGFQDKLLHHLSRDEGEADQV